VDIVHLRQGDAKGPLGHQSKAATHDKICKCVKEFDCHVSQCCKDNFNYSNSKRLKTVKT